MNEQADGPPPSDDDVDAHLLKETLAAGAVAAGIFAGSAQARLIDPPPGGAALAAVTHTPTHPAKKMHKTSLTASQRQHQLHATIPPTIDQ